MIELKDIYNVKFLNSAEFLGSIYTAVSAIGDEVITLYVTEPILVDVNLSIPTNIEIVLEGEGVFNITSGITLTINSLKDAGTRKIAIGSGTLIIKNSPELYQAWYTGTFTGSTYVNELLSSGATSVIVGDASVFGPAPFPLSISGGGESEVVLCTAVDIATNTLTLTRGYDSTTPISHIETVTLAEAIDASETEWDVVSGAAFGVGQCFALVDLELIWVSNVIGNTLYVSRGQGGTTATTHASAAVVSKRSVVCNHIADNMKNGLLASAATTTGCKIFPSSGVWTTKGGWDPPTGSTWEGSGADSDGLGGSTFRLLPGTGNYLFKLSNLKHQIGFEGITFDVKGTTGKTGVQISGPNGGFWQNARFVRCNWVDGDYGVNVYDEAGAFSWMALNLYFDHCRWTSQKQACFRSNVANGSNMFVQPTMTPTGNGQSVCFDLNYAGPTIAINGTFNGVNVAPQLTYTDIASIELTPGSTQGKITTVAPHQLTVNEMVKVSIYNATPANLPEGTVNINRTTGTDVFDATRMDRQEFWAKPISTTELYIYLVPSHAFLGNEDEYRFVFTDAGTGTHQLRTNKPVINSTRPLAVSRLQNTFHETVFLDCQSEGFPWEAIVQNTFEEQRAITYQNCAIQALFRLESRCLLNLKDCWVPANCVTDVRNNVYSVQAEVTAENCQIMYHNGVSGYIDLGTTPKNPNLMTINGCAGDTRIRESTIPDQGHTRQSVPFRAIVDRASNLSAQPTAVLGRDRNIAELSLLQLGLKEAWEEELSFYYNFLYLDPNVTPPPEYSWMEEWLEIRAREAVKATDIDGLYKSGHLAFRGMLINTDLIPLVSTGNVTPLDPTQGSIFYYAGDIGENTTINAVAAHNGVSQPISIRIPSTTTNRNVSFGNNIWMPGNKNFNTGTVAGLWIINGETHGSQIILGEPVHVTAGGVGANFIFKWRYASGTSQQMINNVGYLSNSAGLVTFTLPLTANPGDIIGIVGSGGGGWIIAQNASQQIIWTEGGINGTTQSTAGTGGSLASTDAYDTVLLICTVGNTTWEPINSKGVLEIT